MSKKIKRLLVVVITIGLTISNTVLSFAADNDGWTEANKNTSWNEWCEKWETTKNDWTQLSITPGKNASELNFAWYSDNTAKSPKIKVSKNKDMSNSVVFQGKTSEAVDGYISNKVEVTGLEAETTYYYCYGNDDNYSSVYEISTEDTKSFGFIFVGDPQIGSSSENIATGESTPQGQDKACRNDAFNWNNTLNQAIGIMPNASFILSSGDQIQSRNKKGTDEEKMKYTGNEIEYAGYLSPSILKAIPVATTIGNHDAISGNYGYHFNNPNSSTLGTTIAGGDYYYTYGNTVFMFLNTNNTNVAEHEEFIKNAINSNEDAKWRVVTLHQDIYGSGEHSNEPEIAELRYKLIPIFESNKIDVVLTGHDHTYSRAHILKGGTKDESKFLSDDEFQDYIDGKTSIDDKYTAYLESIEDANSVIDVKTEIKDDSIKAINPEGILYMTANSASGSKYYDLVEKQQSYIASRWQEDVPTFSAINVDDVSFSISTYRTDTLEKIDSTYTIIKSIDKSNLINLIAKAEMLLLNKDKYSEETIKNLEIILEEAKLISNQDDATEDIVGTIYSKLNNAINELVENVEDNKERNNKNLPDNKNEYNNEINSIQKTSNKKTNGVKTGDSFNYMIPAALGLSSIALGCIYIVIRKNRINSK